MGFFTDTKYAYWEWETDNETYTVKMKDIDIPKAEEQINQLVDTVKELQKKREELIKQKESCDETQLSKINFAVLDIESQYRNAFSKGKRLEEKCQVYKRYCKIAYQIVRLKDVYSRQEAIYLQIMNDGEGDGVIISNTSKIAEDIYKVENYGISMQPSYLDELAKIICAHYFDMAVTERNYIDNEIPKGVIQKFAEFCRQKMGKDLQVYLSHDKPHYDVKTTDLNDWYKESPVRRYTFRDIKEALIIYEYVDKPTKGRTDCTIGGQKVIRFFTSVLDKISYEEDEN